MPTRGSACIRGADARVAEDQQDVGFQLDIGLAGAGRMVDAREQLQAMRVERLAQPRLDLVGIAAGDQLDHVRTLSERSRKKRPRGVLSEGRDEAEQCVVAGRQVEVDVHGSAWVDEGEQVAGPPARHRHRAAALRR
jgi:hypothetical protein